MKKFLVFLVTLVLLATSVVVYVQIKAEAEAPKSMPIYIEAGKRITFSHPSWTDTVVFEKGNRMYRQAGDWATVTDFKDGVLTVSWDQWGVEKYKQTAEVDRFELVTE